MPGPWPWATANAPSRCWRSCTKFCSSPIKTGPSTKPWCKPPVPPKWHHWPCCNARGPSPRPTSSIGSGFCLKTSPRAPSFQRCKRPVPPLTCRWPMCRPTPSTTHKPPKSTTPCRYKAWAAPTSPWASTSPRRAWRCNRVTPSIRSADNACPPSTCRATKSPCCPMAWCSTTPYKKDVPVPPCRCMCSSMPTPWPSRAATPVWSKCRSPPTCATTNSTMWSPRSGWTTRAFPTPAMWRSPPCRAPNWLFCTAWRATSKRSAKWCAASPKPSTAPITTFASWV